MNEQIPLRHRLKMILGQTTWPYAIYIKIRNSKKRYPCARTALTVEGYPRSANTFSLYLARELFEGELVSSHIHNISSIKAGIRIKAPCVVLIRDGLESVVSLAQKDGVSSDDRQVLAAYMAQWIQMYEYVEAELEQIALVDFRQLVSMPERFLQLLAHLSGRTLSIDHALKMVASARAKMEAKEAGKAEQGSSLPREERNVQKAVYVEAVQSLESSEYARKLYERLSKEAVDLNHV